MSQKGITGRNALLGVAIAVAILSLLSTAFVSLSTQVDLAVLRNDLRTLEAELNTYQKSLEVETSKHEDKPQQLQPTVEFTLQTSFVNGKFKFNGASDYPDEGNPTLRVKLGDIVKIVLVNSDGVEHDFVIHELNVQADNIHVKGDKTSVVFKAEKTGEFHYYCSVPGHRELGMEGKIIVEAR